MTTECRACRGFVPAQHTCQKPGALGDLARRVEALEKLIGPATHVPLYDSDAETIALRSRAEKAEAREAALAEGLREAIDGWTGFLASEGEPEIVRLRALLASDGAAARELAAVVAAALVWASDYERGEVDNGAPLRLWDAVRAYHDAVAVRKAGARKEKCSVDVWCTLERGHEGACR